LHNAHANANAVPCCNAPCHSPAAPGCLLNLTCGARASLYTFIIDCLSPSLLHLHPSAGSAPVWQHATRSTQPLQPWAARWGWLCSPGRRGRRHAPEQPQLSQHCGTSTGSVVRAEDKLPHIEHLRSGTFASSGAWPSEASVLGWITSSRPATPCCWPTMLTIVCTPLATNACTWATSTKARLSPFGGPCPALPRSAHGTAPAPRSPPASCAPGLGAYSRRAHIPCGACASPRHAAGHAASACDTSESSSASSAHSTPSCSRISCAPGSRPGRLTSERAREMGGRVCRSRGKK
jgi:hypothetical protein